MADSLPAGLGGGGDPVGTESSFTSTISSLLNPSDAEKSATKERQEASSAAIQSIKKAPDTEAATRGELEKNMPKPEDFGLGKEDIKGLEPQKPPKYKPDNPLQDFGGLATVLGVLGGMLTRKPLVTSLNAASGAMSAYHQRNVEDYTKKVEDFNNNQKYISSVLDWREKMYAEADNRFKDDLAARAAARTEVAARAQDFFTMEQIASGDEQKYYQARQDTAKTLIQLHDTNERLSMQAKELGERIRHDKTTESPGAPPDPEMQKAYASQAATGQPLTEVIPGGMNKAAVAQRTAAHDDAVKLIAQQQKIPLTDAAVELAVRQANFRGLETEQRTLGTQAARLNVAGRAAYKAGDMVLNSSANVDRADFVMLNNGEIALRRAYSDPAVATYIANLNTFINTYARAISPTGQARIDDKNHARDLITTGYGKGAVSAVIQSLKQEVSNEQAAVDESRKDIGGEISGKGPTPLAAVGTKDNPVSIDSESQSSLYDKGTWVKMGNRIGQVQ